MTKGDIEHAPRFSDRESWNWESEDTSRQIDGYYRERNRHAIGAHRRLCSCHLDVAGWGIAKTQAGDEPLASSNLR